MTLAGLDARSIADAVEKEALQRRAQNENDLDSLGVVMERVVGPLVGEYGAAAVRGELLTRRSDPNIAALLVRAQFDSNEFGLVVKLGDIYSEQEIVAEAVRYLDAIRSGANEQARPFEQGRWAWLASTNYLNTFSGEEHLRLLLSLVEQAPDDEWTLWMIANGPLETAEADSTIRAQLVAQCESNAKLRRVREMSERVGPPPTE